MALTPEDVVNKRFNPTKFREGYDQDEVDDFLDEVVVELRRLNQENEELRQRLVAGEARIAELQRAGASAAPAAAAPVPAPVAAAPVAAAPAPATPAPATNEYSAPTDINPMDPNATNNLLQLARRLHEEHVREGMEKRDTLIAEGHATAARIVAEAEQTQRTQIAQLQAERSSLESRIQELRGFEKEYREKLREYIEDQLRELDSVGEVAGPTPRAELEAEPERNRESAAQSEPAAEGHSAPPTYPAPGSYGAFPQPEYPGLAAGS